MTPTEQAARWLADVPTYDLWYEGGTLPVRGAIWITQDDALAAIARHLAPGDDLVERLLDDGPLPSLNQIRRDREEAAARMSALTAERDELKAWRRHWQGEIDVILAGRADAEDEVSRLRDRLARMEGERDDALTFLDNAVSKSPQPLKDLGAYLASLLDEDDWPEAERYLNAAVKSCAAITESPADGGSNG